MIWLDAVPRFLSPCRTVGDWQFGKPSFTISAERRRRRADEPHRQTTLGQTAWFPGDARELPTVQGLRSRTACLTTGVRRITIGGVIHALYLVASSPS